MQIGILGTGDVGKTLGTALVKLGHTVCMGARQAGEPKAAAWAAANGAGASAGSFADAACGAEILFNCTSGQHSLSALTLAGTDNLAGKILVDVSNPLDFSRGFPPRLTHMNDTSLAEELQTAFPALRVVKALNTVANPIMVNPGLLPEATDLPICGDDPAAKQAVTELLRGFGWERIVDLGPISQARGTEAWLLLWTRLYGAMRTPLFNMRLVRAA